jgi:hypothetical protein
MTVKELIKKLKECSINSEVYIESPDGEQDFFVEKVIRRKGRVFIITAE